MALLGTSPVKGVQNHSHSPCYVIMTKAPVCTDPTVCQPPSKVPVTAFASAHSCLLEEELSNKKYEHKKIHQQNKTANSSM